MSATNRIGTRGLSREDWLAKRIGTIGASDMPSVCGFGYKTPNEIAGVVSGAVEPDDLSEREDVQLGIMTEPLNAQFYTKKTGRRVHRVNEMRYHPDLPFIHANLDRVAYGEKRIVELKWTNEFFGRATYEQDAESDSHSLPKPVLIQTQTQMAVYTGFDVLDVSVIIGGNRHRVFTVERDQRMIDNVLTIASAFYDRMIRGVPQPIVTYEEAVTAFRQHVARKIEATPEIAAAALRYRELNPTYPALEKEIKALKGIVAGFMGEADELTIGGKTAVTWRTQPDNRFDEAAFKAEHTDLFDQFLPTDKTSRVMRAPKGSFP